MMYWLPACAAPSGTHRQGGGAMFTTTLPACPESFPLKVTIFDSSTPQVELVSHPTTGGPLAALAGCAASADAVRIAASATPDASRPRALGRQPGVSRRVMACTPSPAGSRPAAGW